MPQIISFWKNSWKIVIVASIIFGIISIAYKPIKLKIFPPATIFKEIKTDLYEFKIPEDWNTYEDENKQVYTYSDLTDTSFINGSLTIYNLGNVMRENTELNKEACEIEKQQITDIINKEKYFELEKIEASFDSNKSACISEVKIQHISSEDTFLEMQYHTYISYQIGNSIVIFEIASPEQEFSTDLTEILDSIQIY